MTHEQIPVDRLRAALDAWGLAGDDVAIERIPPGATADVYLVRRGDERWVAKYAYQEPWHFEAGLATSELLDVRDWVVATPVRTPDGCRMRMVEWPDGHDHPLALLRWVDGRVLDSEEPGGIELKATVCGRVHAQLLALDPTSVGVEVVPDSRPPEPVEEWDLGPHQWVNHLFAELQQETFAWRSRVRSCVGVWDGPDIRVRDEDGGVGLIDFGHTSWQPLVNVVANRSLSGPDQGAASLPRFLDTLQQELPLTDGELEAMDTFRRHNAGIYARWAANRVHEHGDDSLAGWLDSLLRFLRYDSGH